MLFGKIFQLMTGKWNFQMTAQNLLVIKINWGKFILLIQPTTKQLNIMSLKNQILIQYISNPLITGI